MEHLQTVQKVFSDKLLEVPNYQRGYAWEEPQWIDMIEDLEVLAESQTHYTGTVVLNKSDENVMNDEGHILEKYNIVDGQQRLVTISILLHCISENLKHYANTLKLGEGIRKSYLVFKDKFSQEKLRLTLNEDCNTFFMRNIISTIPAVEGPVIKAHENLDGALTFYKKYLKKKKDVSPDHYENWLVELYRKIIESLEFTVYEVKQSAEVGVIFETMNNRGKSLSDLDRVKNYLLYLASKLPEIARQELGDKINNEVGKLYRKLMDIGGSSSATEDQLLRMAWLMAYNPASKYWQGYTTIKQHINLRKYPSTTRDVELIKDLNTYIDILCDCSSAYRDILVPRAEDSFKNLGAIPEAREKLVRKAEKILRVGNTASFMPIIMAARIKYPNEYELLSQLLDICEKYAFRIFRLQNFRSNTGQSSLFILGFKLFKKEIDLKKAIQAMNSLLLNYSSDKTYREEFELGRKNWYQFYGLKYFLYEYEESISHGKGVIYPWDRLARKDKQETVEHILPQVPSREYWQSRWNQDQINKYLHDIGNLVLTLDNSIYQNKSFYDKKGTPGVKDCYMNSILFQEREIGAFSEWTEKELLERREKIVRWAIDRWYIYPALGGDLYLDNENDEETDDDQNDPDDNPISAPTSIESKEWPQDLLSTYLDRLWERKKRTYNFLRVLASDESALEFNEAIRRINDISEIKIKGRSMAGISSGLTKQAKKRGFDRLVIEFKEDVWKYKLNEKYRDIIKKHVESRTTPG
ncbi:MAG: DUF262 domain-containing HNH endonuclease family protein [Candidatus Aminicenantales bacterium]|jgi:antitoxin component HigA of HigAB toxin-antitoxin module